MTALLLFEGVACRRGGRLLFEGLDLRLDPGDALAVGGPNGCGKSSLLRLAAGLLRAAEGRVEAALAALADEGLALDREAPLGRALDWWAALDGGDSRTAMTAFGLDQLRDVPVRLLSAGQARRARLARVAASGAPLWLLDEPANGLDLANVAALGRAIDRHRADGGAVIAASHIMLPGSGWTTLELGA